MNFSNDFMNDVVQSAVSGSEISTPGKYLTFLLSVEQYGIPISKVQEIIGVGHITPVPRSGKFMKGVFNLRGKIIPVVDLRLKFGLPPVAYDEKTCIVVVDALVNEVPTALGLIVDTVLEVVSFSAKDIEPPPQYGSTLSTAHIIGMGRMGDDRVSILLDIDAALSEGSVIATKE